ncbi:MAG: glycosyltransferase [Bacilli bacterium]|nr:glycosyltransferase [Bacilli bacterium]
MGIKKIIKNIIPKRMYYRYELFKYNQRKNMSFKSIEESISKRYFEHFGRQLSWDNPKTYTEKTNVSKVYGYKDKKREELTDKYLVRDWIKKQIGEKYLIPIYGVYDSFKEIDFDKLPNKFVIKCNHDSGSVILCKDKSKLDLKKLQQKYDGFFLKRNFAYVGFEMHYKDIKPKIIIEKYMGDKISDYKFLCFDGEPYYCWVDVDRFGNHKRNFYNMNWELQPFNQYSYGNYDKEIPKPKKFDEMKKIVQKLSKGFDHVRVDLYVINNEIYFGEMTFTNGNGFEEITPDEWDYKLGELWNLKSNRK